MTTFSTKLSTSHRFFGRILAGGLLALALAACGSAEGEADDASTVESGESESALTAEKAPGAGKGEGARGEHGRRGPKDPAKMVERFDANKDGKVAVSELPDRAKERLASADADKDGFLSADELKAHKQGLGKERFAKMDRNSDGFLTADELGDRRWEHMKVADANSDAKLTADELKAAHEQGKLEGRHGEGKRRGAKGGEQPQQ